MKKYNKVIYFLLIAFLLQFTRPVVVYAAKKNNFVVQDEKRKMEQKCYDVFLPFNEQGEYGEYKECAAGAVVAGKSAVVLAKALVTLLCAGIVLEHTKSYSSSIPLSDIYSRIKSVSNYTWNKIKYNVKGYFTPAICGWLEYKDTGATSIEVPPIVLQKYTEMAQNGASLCDYIYLGLQPFVDRICSLGRSFSSASVFSPDSTGGLTGLSKYVEVGEYRFPLPMVTYNFAGTEPFNLKGNIGLVQYNYGWWGADICLVYKFKNGVELMAEGLKRLSDTQIYDFTVTSVRFKAKIPYVANGTTYRTIESHPYEADIDQRGTKTTAKDRHTNDFIELFKLYCEKIGMQINIPYDGKFFDTNFVNWGSVGTVDSTGAIDVQFPDSKGIEIPTSNDFIGSLEREQTTEYTDGIIVPKEIETNFKNHIDDPNNDDERKKYKLPIILPNKQFPDPDPDNPDADYSPNEPEIEFPNEWLPEHGMQDVVQPINPKVPAPKINPDTIPSSDPDSGSGSGPDSGPDLSLPDKAEIDFKPLKDLVLFHKFPFCIPWDIYNAVKEINIPKKSPHWEFPLPWGNKIIIDFEQFGTLLTICRYFLLLIFIVNLAILTRYLIQG